MNENTNLKKKIEEMNKKIADDLKNQKGQSQS